MSKLIKDLGAVSAYAYAVEKGYTGTEDEFAELMYDYADVAQTAVEAKDEAVSASTSAQASATIANTKAVEASASASNAQSASNSAQGAETNAETFALNAGTKATEAKQFADKAELNAQKTQSDKEAVESAKSDVLSAVDSAQNYANSAQLASQAIQNMSVEATTLEPDSDATVEKTVDAISGAVTLTYGIPKGQVGEKGDKGNTGDSGVYIGTSAPLDENVKVWIDSDGEPDDVILIDTIPTQGSTNAVSSGGVYEALQAVEAEIPDVDDTLTQTRQAADAKKTGDEITSLKEDLNEITTIGTQLFNKDNAETEHWTVTNGVVYAGTYTTSVIIPVNPSESDDYITVHRNTITSRFRVSTFTAKPAVGSTAVDTTAQDNASTITVACDTIIKYIMVVFHHSTDDASITAQSVLDGLMVEFGASYTGYEPYSLRVIIPTKSVDGDSFSNDGIGFITDIVDVKTEDAQTFTDNNKHQTVSKTDVTLTWTEGSYYNFTTGEITALSGRAYSAKMDCKAGDRISVTNNKGQILYWDAVGNFVSYLPTDYPSTVTYVVPVDVTKFALNNSDSTIRASIATVRTDSFELITKTYNAPARLIFDSDAFEQGKYCSTTNGKISTLSSYWCLPFVPVKPNHKYRTEDQTQVVFYDSAGAFLSALLPNGSASWTGVDTEMDFTTPANCAYISVNAQNAHEKLFDMEPYTVIGDIINPQKLQGKTVICFGDSITGNYGFGDNYPYQVEQITGAKTYNCGFGGCRMELIDTDAQHTNPFSMCGIVDALEAAKNGDATAWDEQDEYAESISKMVYLRLQVLKAIDWSKVDIVTIAYGTNEGGYPQDDEENPTNKYTYGGATRYAVNKLLTLYPHLRIVLLTPIYRFYTSEGVDSDTHTHPTYGGKLTDNVETLIKIGSELKVPVLDLYHTLGINITNYTSYFGDEDEQSDGTHINSFGREQMGRRVAGELNRFF